MVDFKKAEYSNTEMYKLASMLLAADIPFEVNEQFWPVGDTIQIYYPNIGSCVCDVICNPMSFGHEAGLLEMMGLCGDEEVLGYLTAAQVFKHIKFHWNSTKKGE